MRGMFRVSMFHGPADRKTQEEGEEDVEGESEERESDTAYRLRTKIKV